MPLVKCPDCGKEISPSAPSCPHCGRPQSPAMAATTATTLRDIVIRAVAWSVGVSSVLFIAVQIFGGWDSVLTDIKRQINIEIGTTQTTQGIYPETLQGTKPFELGELILLLMPDSSATFVGWDHRADSRIVWQTTGYETVPKADGTSKYVRNGIVRVNIQGKKSTVLRQRTTELGWTVSYSSVDPPKFGPEQITIEPGLPQEGGCFGTNYEGCDFDEPLNSLSSAGVGATKICGKREMGGASSAFLLTHAARRSTVLVWVTSGGSGGSSAWLTLKLNEKPNAGLCDN